MKTKLVQLIDSEGEPVGLYTCPVKYSDQQVEQLFKELQEQAVCQIGECIYSEDQVYEELEELLMKKNISRVFVTEITSIL